MPATDDIAAGVFEAFDALRAEFLPERYALELLVESEDADEFEVIETVLDGWFLDKLARPPMLSIARNDPFLPEKLRRATNVRIGEETFVLIIPETETFQTDALYYEMNCEINFAKSQYGAIY